MQAVIVLPYSGRMTTITLTHSLPMTSEVPHPNADRDELQRLLDGKLLYTVLQPIVDIANGVVLGYEALARGPQDSRLAKPDQLFAAAACNRQLAALEYACREACSGLRQARPTGLPHSPLGRAAARRCQEAGQGTRRQPPFHLAQTRSGTGTRQ
ncbi:EAL domain-containing protein [Proteobacteria bacterium 005FR1]|nr:EAL domain-containing protein [Proteobacteria bacterium 005FR1]